MKEEEGNFEPINLCKFKEGFEASLHHAFDDKKVLKQSEVTFNTKHKV